MNRFACLLLGTILFHVGAVSTRAQQGSPEQELIRLEKQWAEAVVKGDNSFFDRTAADDYVIVDAGGDVRHKQQELALARNEKMDTCTFDALSVRIHEDSAVVVGRYSLSGTNAGRPFSETGVSTDMWAKRGGKWLLVGTQNTSVPATSHSAADDTKEMLKIEKDLLNTYITGDMAVRERYVADDFAGVDLNGETFTKQSDIQDVKTGEFVVKSFNMTNEKVSFLNPDVALLTYEIAYEATENGENRSTHSRVGVVYVRRNGAWRYLYSQETQIKNSQAAGQQEVRNQSNSASDEPDEAVMKAIVANEQKILEVLKRNDITAFGNLLPEDVIMVEDDGIHTKPVWLKEFEEQKKTGLLFTDFKMEDLRLVRYGASAATLVFKETVDGLQNGKPFEWHINSSSGYVKRGDRWVPVLYQDVMAK